MSDQRSDPDNVVFEEEWFLVRPLDPSEPFDAFRGFIPASVEAAMNPPAGLGGMLRIIATVPGPPRRKFMTELNALQVADGSQNIRESIRAHITHHVTHHPDTDPLRYITGHCPGGCTSPVTLGT